MIIIHGLPFADFSKRLLRGFLARNEIGNDGCEKHSNTDRVTGYGGFYCLNFTNGVAKNAGAHVRSSRHP